MTEPRKSLGQAGAKTEIVSTQGRVQGWNHQDEAQWFQVDVELTSEL